MDNILSSFYLNSPQRKAVLAFQIQTLGEIAQEMAFQGKDTGGIKEAKLALEKSFDKLEDLYGEKQKPTSVNTR